MKFKIESQTKATLLPLTSLGFVDEDSQGNLTADVNIVDLAQISHRIGFPLKVVFNDKTGYVITVLDG